MATVMELGRLCLNHPRAKLQLTSDVVVTAYSSQTALGENLGTDISQSLTAGSAWVCRGQRFHLTLEICLGGHPLDSISRQHLANSICSTDLWAQLNFRAAASAGLPPGEYGDRHECGDRGNSANLVIELTHCDLGSHPQTSRHRLPTGASISDVRPPDGVDAVYLNTVNLTIAISTYQRQKRKTKEENQGSVKLHMQGSTALDGSAFEAGPCEGDEEDTMLLDEPQELMAAATLSDHEESLHSNPSRPSERIDSGTALADDYTSKGGAGQHEPEQHRLQHVLELLDSALRLTICDKPTKIPACVKVKENTIAPTLSVLAPAIWSPKYLRVLSAKYRFVISLTLSWQGVSERALFIPTIAHALSHSLFANARSDSLKRKVTELESQYPSATYRPGPSPPEHVRQDQGGSFVYESTSIGLWHLLQRGLFNPGASRRLKPLNTHSLNSSIGEANADNEMLADDWDGRHQDFDPFVDGEGLFNSTRASQESLPDEELLWECEDAYDQAGGDPLYQFPSDLYRIDRPETHLDRADEAMLLDSVNLFQGGESVGPEDHTRTYDERTQHDIPADFQKRGMEASLFDDMDQIETAIRVDAYDSLAADPEILFDSDF